MPLAISAVAAGSLYASPWVGRIDHPAHVKVDISGLTDAEVDVDGYLKPGLPLTIEGLRIGVQAAVGTAVSAAQAGNTGNGTMGAVTVSAGAKAGVYTLEIIAAATNAGTFQVTDPDGNPVATGNVAAAFAAGGLAFTLADGATDFVPGDGFTITVTLTAGGATTSRIFGATIEAALLPITLPRTNTTLSNETGDCFVAVNTIGLINRDAAEDCLGRSYTAAELAAFVAPGCHIALTST